METWAESCRAFWGFWQCVCVWYAGRAFIHSTRATQSGACVFFVSRARFVTRQTRCRRDPNPPSAPSHAPVGDAQGAWGQCLSCHSGTTADPLPVFPALDVASWGDGGLCEAPDDAAKTPNATGALITFLTPPARSGDNGDLELLQVSPRRRTFFFRGGWRVVF